MTKRLFLQSLSCPASGWYSLRETSRPPGDPAREFKRREEEDVRRIARTLFPRGVLIEEREMEAAAARTEEFREAPDGTCLFGGAFLREGFGARTDILLKEGGLWRLIEVKAGLKDKGAYLRGGAYASMVMEMSGWPLSEHRLWLLDRNYRTGMPPEALFREIDHSSDTALRARAYLKEAAPLRESLLSPERPEQPFAPSCKNCPYLSRCFAFDLKEHIVSLPFFSRKLYDRLTERGLWRLEDLPSQTPLTPEQEMVRTSLVEGRVVVAPGLKEDLNRVEWPAFYLDFETTMTALPLYPDTAPYQQIPTQYSVHLCAEPGEAAAHREYLADPSRDCRRELAERLLEDLEGSGSILVYSRFEQRVIGGLARLFPDLTEPLHGLIPRLVDLERMIRRGISHPDFLGRSSIKKTLPALVPQMGYGELPIAEGAAALAAFARMAKGRVPEEEIPALREDLLRYCRRDTLGMVKLHQALIQYAK